jgi:hypothetical protein
MKMLKMCLNWKVIAALVAVGIGFYAIAPKLAIAALPFLVLAICPLSMMFMMKGMQGGQGGSGEQQASDWAEGDSTREGELTRLRVQQTALEDQIGALEREEELRSSRNKPGRLKAALTESTESTTV